MNDETVLGLSKGEKMLIILIPPILGALLGWFLPTIAEWATKLPFIPFDQLIEWIAALDSYWVSLIAMLVGLLAGIFFTLYAFSESLKVSISDQEVQLSSKEKVRTILRKDISAIFVEDKQLVLLGTDGVELYRGQLDSKKGLTAEAFKQHRYPWVEQDPFENQYFRWVVDHPDFSRHVNTLLYARERALKNDKQEEATALRKDLINLGVVVRDEDKRQYVRSVQG